MNQIIEEYGTTLIMLVMGWAVLGMLNQIVDLL